MNNVANCKTEIGTLRHGCRFRSVTGHEWVFDHWFKGQDQAVVVKDAYGTEDVFAACAKVEHLCSECKGETQ